MNTLNIPVVLGRVAKLPAVSFEIEGTRVRTVLELVCDQHNQLKEHLFYENGDFKNHFLLSVNGAVAHLDEELPANSTIDVILAASGGMNHG